MAGGCDRVDQFAAGHRICLAGRRAGLFSACTGRCADRRGAMDTIGADVGFGGEQYLLWSGYIFTAGPGQTGGRSVVWERMMGGDPVVLIALFAPLVGAVLIVCLGRYPNLREAATLTTGAVLLCCMGSIYQQVAAGERPGAVLGEPIPGLALAFEVEPLGMVFGLVAAFLWIVTTIYSIGYMRGHGEENQTRFYACFAIAIGAAVGVAFSANAFCLFVYYEVLTLSTYPLVTHAGTEQARQGGAGLLRDTLEHLHRSVFAGLDLDLVDRRDPGFHPGRDPQWRADRHRFGGVTGVVRIRHR